MKGASIWLGWILCFACALGGLTPRLLAQGRIVTIDATFVVNDALVKNRVLTGAIVSIKRKKGEVPIFTAATDRRGRVAARLAQGTYLVTYRRRGYVSVRDARTRLYMPGQVITTTLSPSLEATGTAKGKRQVRIILNWGSSRVQAKDVDSHVLCLCGRSKPHVYFSHKHHASRNHRAVLDVDDVDWGGPETITFTDPPMGRHYYWVHKFSAGRNSLGASDVVVRVLFGDEEAGTFQIPRDLTSRDWRPFKALVIGPKGQPSLEGFSADELAKGLDRRAARGYRAVRADDYLPWVIVAVALFTVFFVGIVVAKNYH